MPGSPCPFCGVTSSALASATSCPVCHEPLTVLDGAYRLDGLLGSGGMGSVHAALGVSDGAPVAVKILTLGVTSGWKAYELFERSVGVLEGLRHHALPTIFGAEKRANGALVLVRERFDGGTLAERLLESNERTTAAQIEGILTSLLELLAYLHGYVPPILHRDIKPANIMFRTRDDLDPVLVDFDTVAAPSATRDLGTIVASPGYTAPEQLGGRASPAADLYGLGATMVAVVTRTEAHELIDRYGTLADVPLPASLPSRVATVLLRMVEPDVHRRLSSAHDALDLLRGTVTSPRGGGPSMARQPYSTDDAGANDPRLADTAARAHGGSTTTTPSDGRGGGSTTTTRSDGNRKRTSLFSFFSHPEVLFGTIGLLAGLVVWGIVSLTGSGQEPPPEETVAESMPAPPAPDPPGDAAEVATWRFEGEELTCGVMAASEAGVFVVDEESTLVALDPATGAVRWKSPISTPLGTSLAAGEDFVSVGGIGSVQLLEAADGAKRWSSFVGFGVAMSGVAGARLVSVGTDARVVVHDVVTGATIMDAKEKGLSTEPLVISGSDLFVGSTKGYLYGYHLETGTRFLDARPYKEPLYLGGAHGGLIIGSKSGDGEQGIFAVDTETGEVAWLTPVSFAFSVVVHGGKVYGMHKVSGNYSVFVLDAAKGTWIGSFDLETTSPPALAVTASGGLLGLDWAGILHVASSYDAKPLHWSTMLDGGVERPHACNGSVAPLVVGSRAFVLGGDGRLLALELATLVGQ